MPTWYRLIITELSSHLHGLDLIFRKGAVRITVKPALARLRRSNHRMPALVRVFAGVTVRRAVAAERDAAFLARSQMHPVCAGLHAFFAFAALRLFDRRDRVDVGTGRHTSLPLFAQHVMDGGHRDRSFPNCRGNAFHIAGTHVADREHSG